MIFCNYTFYLCTDTYSHHVQYYRHVKLSVCYSYAYTVTPFIRWELRSYAFYTQHVKYMQMNKRSSILYKYNGK